MYVLSTTRRYLTAVVLVAALSGLISASIQPVPELSRVAAQQARSPLPVLPEIVVTADRLPQ